MSIEKRIESLMKKISPQERIGIEEHVDKLIYSVVGFMPACDGVDNPLLISNLAYTLSQKGLNVCVVDFKVFYPNLYQFLDVKPNKKGDGLLKVLRSDKADFRDEINATKYERLYMLNPSPQDLMEEYFDIDFENVERVISTLKNMFDLILIDIPNIPPLELCIGAMKYCHIGFFTSTERIEAANNMMKLLDFASSIGVSTAKFTSVILMNLQELQFDFKVLEDLNFNVAAKLPMVKSALVDSFVGKLYVKDNPLVNKFFITGIDQLADRLINQ
ncbi:P-loop NTPase family protein [Alkaliphilus transvaalensis]|uniref:hypothetical protein n=1 Tax=Alkaliphilus transvaalensis TaxID=114628 RepID=UPI00047AF746|nr:hypothetical protein [Alkaliphilus transvaalensis]